MRRRRASSSNSVSTNRLTARFRTWRSLIMGASYICASLLRIAILRKGGTALPLRIAPCRRPSALANASRREDQEFRPPRLPACRLGLVEVGAEVRAEIGPDGQRHDVIETVRGVDLKPVLYQPNADLGRHRQKAIDAVRGPLHWRIRSAKFFRIPEVDAALVAELDASVDIGQTRCRAANDYIFRAPGCLRIESA